MPLDKFNKKIPINRKRIPLKGNRKPVKIIRKPLKKRILIKQKPKINYREKIDNLVSNTMTLDYNGMLLMPSEFDIDYELKFRLNGLENTKLGVKVKNFCTMNRGKLNSKQSLLNNFEEIHSKKERIEVEKIFKDLMFCSVVKGIKRKYKIDQENDKEIENIRCNFKRYKIEDVYYCLKYLGNRLNTSSELFNMPLICKDVENKLVTDNEYTNQINYIKSLRDEETNFLIDYSTINYTRINNALRSDQWLKELDILNGVYERSPKTNESFHVFRDTSNFEIEIFKKGLKELKKGDIFQELGFLSTTWRPTYIGSGRYGCCVIVIKIPKNSNVLFIEKISEVENENEVLLRNGAKLKVISNTVKKVLDIESLKRIGVMRLRKYAIMRIIKLELVK